MRRLLLFAALLAPAGCGPAGPAPVPVLVVTVDGAPVGYLSVQLVGDAGLAVTGVTDAAGRVGLVSADKPVPPGAYKVVVTDTGESDDYGNDTSKQAKPRPKTRVPAAYGKAATTPASVTVEAGRLDYAVDVRAK